MALRSKVGLQFAAVAAALVLAVGTAIFQTVQLRNGLNLVHTESAALDLRAQELERQLGDQRQAHAAIVEELERVRESATLLPRPAAAAPPARAGSARDTLITALVLLPQTRDNGPMPTFAIPSGADHVPFQLRLESDDFRQYQVGLKDPATNEIVWRSGWIAATAPGGWPSVSVDVPAGKLKAQHYSLDLMGREAAGTAEVVGSYAFQISRR
jgi:hypothetical protein